MKQTKRDRTPPRLAEWLLEWGVPKGRTGQSIVGDAREEFDAHVRSGSRVPSALWYWLHVFPIVIHGLFLGLGAAPGALPGALSAFIHDLRLACRTLIRRPGLALAVVSTMAIGIGGNTVAFSIVNAVLLDPLPYDEPDELVGIFRFRTDNARGAPPASVVGQSYSVPPMTFRDWQDGGRSFEAMGAFEDTDYSYTTSEGPMRLSGVNATSGAFRAFAVSPVLGRTFLPEEDEIGGPRVAVIAFGFWERALASDPDVLGRALSLNGVPHIVVGVMPRGFAFPYEGVDLWAPLPDDRRGWPTRSGGFLQVVGRLAEGVTMDEAQQEMAALQTGLVAAHEGERDRMVRLYSWREMQVAQSRPGILLLLGATGLVLLIACANIVTLLLVRALERDRELAIRIALGGGRRHLVAQLVSEGMVLTLVGGGAAFLVAAAGVGPLLSVLPVSLPNAGAIRIDPTVMTFTVLLSCATGLATGLVPALRMMRTPTGSVLREGGRGCAGGSRTRAHTFLAVAEMALAFVLLSGAGLSLKSFLDVTSVDPGFESANRLAMRVRLPTEYRGDGVAISRFFEELTERLSVRPEVEGVGAASQMPYSGGMSFPPGSLEIGDGVVNTIIHNSAVTHGYFAAAGMRMISGRPLTADDRAGALPVAVVNEALARAAWPDESPIGRRVRLDLPGDSVWRTVVGVVENVRYAFGRNPFPEFYTTIAQRPLWYQTVLVHASGDQATVARAMRETLWSLDASIPVTVLTWDELAARSRGFTFARFGSFAMTALAALAALLAVVGVYGVMAFAVRMRSHEFGVRVALGGSQPAILWSVFRRGFQLAAVGIIVGLGIVLPVGRFLDPTLFQSGTRDPFTLSLVALLLLGTGLGASVLPAFRATRVDPVKALRAE